ncbi:MAG TPA: ABC transporter permease [Ktedonobacterales bacterium]|jgi:peptide/nickel transport system permease protein
MPENKSTLPEEPLITTPTMVGAGGVGGPVGGDATAYAIETEAAIIGPDTFADDQVAVQQLTQLELVWRRFRRHRMALVGAAMLGTIIFMAIFAPFLTHTKPDTPHLDWVSITTGATGPSLANFPDRIMGTDTIGHSIWADVIFGSRISLIIGVVAALLSTAIGTALGAISGYFGGWVDLLLMRFTDIILAIPFLPLMIAISAIIVHDPKLHQNSTFIVIFVILAFSLLTWPGVARLVRSYYLSFREQEFTEAAKAVGVNDFRIIFRHILPNAIGPVIVTTTLSVAGFIVLEATLDFLGLGIVFPPTPTWGNILTSAQDVLLIGQWWWATFPGLMLLLTVLAINFMGDGLRDALDVRSKE